MILFHNHTNFFPQGTQNITYKYPKTSREYYVEFTGMNFTIAYYTFMFRSCGQCSKVSMSIDYDAMQILTINLLMVQLLK